jgi:heme/copper-type cytochrome/quinol oxidase subunit 1
LELVFTCQQFDYLSAAVIFVRDRFISYELIIISFFSFFSCFFGNWRFDEELGMVFYLHFYSSFILLSSLVFVSGNRIISPENQNFYNISITLHGFLMIFFLVMPGLFGGFGNYFVPIFQGSPEVVYPRVNNFSILILILSYLFVILSLISEFGGGTGWTLYPPLSTSFMSLSPSSTAFMVFGLLMSGISSSLTSVNFWTTILNLRSYYLSLKTIPLFP